MKSSLSIIQSCSTRLKLIFRENGISRYFSSQNLGFSSLCCLEDESSIFEDTVCINNGVFLNVKSNPVEFGEYDLYFPGSNLCDFVDKDYLVYEHQQTDDDEDDEMKTIKSILKDRGWKLGSSNGYEVDLNESNIIRILDVLFEETSNASLSFYFFSWSETFTGSIHTLRSICRMIHILVSGNMNHRAVDLILHLVTYHGGEEGSYDPLLKLLYATRTERKVLEIVYSMLVHCYIKENMVFLALRLTYQMKNLDTFPSRLVCKSLIRALLVSREFDLAWDLLGEMQNQGMGLDPSIISLFTHQYCMEGNLDSGWKLLLEMKDYGFKPDSVSYTIIINSLCKISHLKEATSLLFKMSEFGVSPDSVSVSSVIDGYCKVGQDNSAISILEIFNPPLNIFIYNSFISMLCIEGDMGKASEIFYEMTESGLQPDYVSYTTLIGGYCKVRNVKKAFEYLGKMLKRRIKPSVTTYTLLIDMFCKFSDTDMGECLFRRMISEGLRPDIVTYNTLMDGYGKKGHLHKAYELLGMMRSAGITPDVITYNTLIHGLIQRGFLNEAKDILDELIRRGFSVDVVTFTDVIDGFSKRGSFEEAFLVWFYMTKQDVKPDVVTCSTLLNGYCREKRMEEANVLFRKMLDIGLNPDVILYNTLIHGFCSIGDVNEACKMVSKMVETGIIPNEITHQALVLGFEKKRVKNPSENASVKLREILLTSGSCVHANNYLRMMEKAESVES